MLRADAERNRDSVLDHAARLLAEDPGVGMADIARAADVGRATLYRHFPTREELIAAIDARAAAEVEAAIAASRLEEGGVGEALHRLVAELLAVGDRYRFLLAEGDAGVPEEERAARNARLGAPLYALVERGQAAGELSRALSPRWTLTVFGAVLVNAVREIAAGHLDRSAAADVVTGTLLRGYGRD